VATDVEQRRSDVAVRQDLSCVIEDYDPVAEQVPALFGVRGDDAGGIVVGSIGLGTRWRVGALVTRAGVHQTSLHRLTRHCVKLGQIHYRHYDRAIESSLHNDSSALWTRGEHG